MNPGMAVFLLVFGLPAAIWPYGVARFEERIDAIGSKRSWSEVEPADWKVGLTRIMGIVMAIGGTLGLLIS